MLFLVRRSPHLFSVVFLFLGHDTYSLLLLQCLFCSLHLCLLFCSFPFKSSWNLLVSEPEIYQLSLSLGIQVTILLTLIDSFGSWCYYCLFCYLQKHYIYLLIVAWHVERIFVAVIYSTTSLEDSAFLLTRLCLNYFKKC